MPTTYGFTGQRGDVVSGLDYYGSRYYDPMAGQFTSGDSVLPGGGFDLWGLPRYAYVEGNPVDRMDPSGHCFCGDPGSGDNFFPQSGGRLLNGETGEVFSGPSYSYVYHLDWSGYHHHHYQPPRRQSTPRRNAAQRSAKPAPKPSAAAKTHQFLDSTIGYWIGHQDYYSAGGGYNTKWVPGVTFDITVTPEKFFLTEGVGFGSPGLSVFAAGGRMWQPHLSVADIDLHVSGGLCDFLKRGEKRSRRVA
jgi:RHS repeat-associated protein